MARPIGVPTAVGAPSGQQQCQCGAGMKPAPGTTPPGQPPVSMRPMDTMVNSIMPNYAPPSRQQFGQSFNNGSMQVSRPQPTPTLFGTPGREQPDFQTLFGIARERMF